MSKLHINGIITGDLDFYCLLCETHLRGEENAHNHIEKWSHKSNLLSSMYLEKFKDDNIRKVKAGYFCEFCNILLSTIAKTNLHVTDSSHLQNKNRLILEWLGTSVKASNNALITGKAWNGFIEDTCAICNLEFDDEAEHMGDTSHILNLIKKPVKYGENGFMFRMVDEISYHCLTCNAIFAVNSLSSHHDDKSHKKSRDISDVSSSETKEADKDKIFEHLEVFQKKGININFETDTAFCTKCSSNVEKNSEAIKSHIRDHQTKLHCDPKKPEISTSKIGLTRDKTEDINNNEGATSAKVKVAEPKAFAKAITANQLDQPKESVEKINNAKVEAQKQSKDGPDHKINDHCDPNQQEISTSKIELIDEKSDNNEGAANAKENVAKPKALAKDTTENELRQPKEPEVKVNNNAKVEAKMRSQVLEDTSAFAKANELTYNKGINTSYCRICKTKLPSTLHHMKEHVAGANHTKNKKITEAKIKSEETERNRVYVPKKPLSKFTDYAIQVKGFFMNDMVVDEKYCMTYLGFHMITVIGRLRCQLCEINLETEDIDEHIDSPNHETAVEESLVVTNLGGEFVREVRKGLYHCGFCNLIAGEWKELQLHLVCEDHKKSRIRANFKLLEHLPDVREFRKRDQMVRNMLFGFFSRI